VQVKRGGHAQPRELFVSVFIARVEGARGTQPQTTITAANSLSNKQRGSDPPGPPAVG